MAKLVDPAFAAGALRVRDYDSGTGRESPTDLVRLHQLPLDEVSHKRPFVPVVEQPRVITDADRKDELIRRGVSEAVACKLSKTPGMLQFALDHETMHAKAAAEEAVRRIEANYRMVSLNSATLPSVRAWTWSTAAELLDNPKGGTRFGLDVDAVIHHSDARFGTVKDGLTGQELVYLIAHDVRDMAMARARTAEALPKPRHEPNEGVVLHDAGRRRTKEGESFVKLKAGATGTGKTEALRAAAEEMGRPVVGAGLTERTLAKYGEERLELVYPPEGLIASAAKLFDLRTIEKLLEIAMIVSEGFPAHFLCALRAAVQRKNLGQRELAAFELGMKAGYTPGFEDRLCAALRARYAELQPQVKAEFMARGAEADRCVAVVEGDSQATSFRTRYGVVSMTHKAFEDHPAAKIVSKVEIKDRTAETSEEVYGRLMALSETVPRAQ